MKKIVSVLLLLVAAVCAYAQMADPVHFTSKLVMLGGDEAQIEFSARIDQGWHVYSTGLGNDGPISATFNATKMDGVKTVGGLTHKGKEISQFDNMFGMKLRYFEGSVTFIQKIKFTKPEYSINCYLEYGACNDETCMPPTSVDFIKSGKAPAVAKDAATAPTEKEAETVKSDQEKEITQEDTLTGPVLEASASSQKKKKHKQSLPQKRRQQKKRI